MAKEGIKVTGIIAEEVGHPRNDETRGSGLYEVPLGLSRTPSSTWAELFVHTWDNPPRFTTMHRPGIASVSGDRIILDGTTVEEVERYHAETLRSVVAKVNDDAARIEERETARKEAEEAARGTHEATVREVANRVPFEE